MDKIIGFPNIYPKDSAIQLFNNWGYCFNLPWNGETFARLRWAHTMTVSSIEGDVKMLSSVSIQDVNWYFSAKYVDTK